MFTFSCFFWSHKIVWMCVPTHWLLNITFSMGWSVTSCLWCDSSCLEEQWPIKLGGSGSEHTKVNGWTSLYSKCTFHVGNTHAHSHTQHIVQQMLTQRCSLLFFQVMQCFPLSLEVGISEFLASCVIREPFPSPQVDVRWRILHKPMLWTQWIRLYQSTKLICALRY